MDEGAGTVRARQEARLLRRVTEAANDTSATSVLFGRVTTDIVTTMDWRSGRVLDVVGDDLAPHDGSSAEPITAVALKTLRDMLPHAGLSNAGSAGGVVALPVVVDGGVTAVLEFMTDEPVELDDEMRRLFAAIGRQMGSVEEREQILATLDARTAELERSNGELERFAYVASHDLQEPLRKIVGFSELLGDRYDEVGREYLGYVVDGVRRMQQLIKDLLARVDTRPGGGVRFHVTFPTDHAVPPPAAGSVGARTADEATGIVLTWIQRLGGELTSANAAAADVLDIDLSLGSPQPLRASAPPGSIPRDRLDNHLPFMLLHARKVLSVGPR